MQGKVVTIFGGSGFIGRYIVEKLAKAGAEIRVAVRNPDKALYLKTMGEIGQSMEDRYKETAQGGLAATKTGQRIAKKVLIHDIDILPDH